MPFNLDMLLVILPFSITLALVGLLESLLTAQLLDDLTDSDSDKNRESRGQGIANVATGFLGGMAGCAMIGQSMINHKTGGRTRLSTLASGVFLIVLILALGDFVAQIPMGALVAVMVMVSVSTFNWHSVAPDTIRIMPRTETIVMLATVAITVLTHNLAYGVGAGVALSAVFFVRHVSHVVNVTSVVDPDNVERLYDVSGELFFASTNDLVHSFDYDAVEVSRVEIDLSNARIWDTSAVVALDAVVEKFSERGISAELVGTQRPLRTPPPQHQWPDRRRPLTFVGSVCARSRSAHAAGTEAAGSPTIVLVSLAGMATTAAMRRPAGPALCVAVAVLARRDDGGGGAAGRPATGDASARRTPRPARGPDRVVDPGAGRVPGARASGRGVHRAR